MISIVSPVYLGQPHRVEYHRKFIESCKRQMDFDKIQFIFFYENTILDYDLIDDLKKYNNVDIHINSYDFKILANHYNCFNYCFEYLNLEHVIYVEDDVEMSNDLHDITNSYVNSAHYLDSNIFCYLNKDNLMNRSNTRSDVIEIKNFEINGMNYFTPWGFLATKYLWKNVIKNWTKDRSVDFEIVEKFKNTHNIVCPQESRINHIGVIGKNYNEQLFANHNFSSYKVKNYSKRINYIYV